jgi:DNA primase
VSLSPQWLDELRARTTLSAVIGPSVKLIKAGREFKACCPFHNEKTPSFTVNDEKGFYHCFGCGAHGDAIRFLTDNRGLQFMDAVKELAGKAGMEIPAPDPRAQAKAERAAGLYEIMEEADRWFVEQLEGVDGSAARAYLQQRGITDATRRKFAFGFAPDARGRLRTALKAHGDEKLVEAGLLIAPDDGKQPYDRFRGRLTYPIRDARGRCIAFSARILGQGEPKYLNSPDTPLFDKGRTLFNLDKAGPASRAARRIIVVEGQMDAIALDQAGIGEVVAPLGTAMTEQQLGLLWRLSPSPILCFDGDSAGQKAAIRAALRALPHVGPDRTLGFVGLPSGQDPDDLVRSGGRQAIEELLGQPQPLVEQLWRHEVDSAPLDTPETRAGLKARLMDHVQTIADPNVRQLYRDEWLRRFDALVRPQQQQHQARSLFPRREWTKKGGRFVPPAPPTLESTRGLARSGVEAPIARALLQGFILYPDALHDHVEELAHLSIKDRGCATLRDQLVQIALSGQHLDREGLQTILAERTVGSDVRRGAMRFSFTQQSSNPAVALSDLGAALEAVIARTEIELALAEATRRLEQDFTETAFAEQQRLIAAKKSYNDRLASLASNE